MGKDTFVPVDMHATAGIPISKTGKAETLPIFSAVSCRRPFMRGFHGAWAGFFVAFIGWFAFAPVGGEVAPHNPPGFVATAYNLLTPPYFNSDAYDCGGPGTSEPHPQNTICPAVFRQHPDWFTCQPTAAGEQHAACTVATVNETYNSQPCWLAPGVKETMTKSIFTILRADPTTKLISVSNMDGGMSAVCALDMVAAKYENATGVSTMLRRFLQLQ